MFVGKHVNDNNVGVAFNVKAKLNNIVVYRARRQDVAPEMESN